MWRMLKKWGISLLERHPLGYALGVMLVNKTDLFLPHEADYLAFPVLAQVFDAAFHEGIIEATENRVMIEAYERISGRVRAIRYRFTHSPQQVSRSTGP